MANIAKRHSQSDPADFMRKAYAGVHRKLALDLENAANTVGHDGVRGDVTENAWIEVLRSYLPKRYAVDKGIVIDSDGRMSDQIDIVIYDPQYTPVLLTQDPHRYIPAEAVYAVLEAKPEINKGTLEYAGAKAASVRRLRRTSVPIQHSDGERPPKSHFPIVAGFVAANVGWVDGFAKSFSRVLRSEGLAGDLQIDCGCGLSHGAFDTFDLARNITLGEVDTGLVFFLFRLLGKLQSLGTVPAIDWNAYSRVM